jgi:ureidoacrylate peracid hydrolase
VDPAHSALVVIDAQHDFCSPRGAIARRFGFDMKEIQEAIPRLNAFIEECRRIGVFVVWVRETLSDPKMHLNQKALWGGGDDIWLVPEDGPGSDWDEHIVGPNPDEPVITKHSYDAFQDTDFELLLRSRGIESLLMTGFQTNICVETTARHGYLKGYYIALVADCTGAPTLAEHEAALFNIKTYFGHVTSSSEIAGLWQRDHAIAAAASP